MGKGFLLVKLYIFSLKVQYIFLFFHFFGNNLELHSTTPFWSLDDSFTMLVEYETPISSYLYYSFFSSPANHWYSFWKGNHINYIVSRLDAFHMKWILLIMFYLQYFVRYWSVHCIHIKHTYIFLDQMTILFEFRINLLSQLHLQLF